MDWREGRDGGLGVHFHLDNIVFFAALAVFRVQFCLCGIKIDPTLSENIESHLPPNSILDLGEGRDGDMGLQKLFQANPPEIRAFQCICDATFTDKTRGHQPDDSFLIHQQQRVRHTRLAEDLTVCFRVTMHE